MPTTHQHFVPRAYLKPWETCVRNSKEPNKKFDGVYIFENGSSRGEGANIKSILWSQSIYTIKYDDYHYIHGKYPAIDKDFLSGIRGILDNSYKERILAHSKEIAIMSDQDILDNLVYLDDWDFKYSGGGQAPNNKIINAIKGLTSRCLEEAFDRVFERDWLGISDAFLSEVEDAWRRGESRPYQISQQLSEDMIKFFYSMLCRNPEFDAFGIYRNVRDRILQPVGMDKDFIDEIMHPQWFGELYKMLFDENIGFFKLAISETFNKCQMILFRRYDEATTFITSDNPAFRHISFVERLNSNGLYFPLSPDYLLMIVKGNEGINKVDYRFADDKTVREFNRKVSSHKNKILVSNKRYLPL